MFSVCCDCNELFTLTLYGIPVSAQYVSFMPAVLRPRLNDQLLHMQIDEPVRNDKIEKKSDAVSEGNPVTNLEYARVNKSIIYVATHEQKAPINLLFRKKNTQNTAS